MDITFKDLCAECSCIRDDTRVFQYGSELRNLMESQELCFKCAYDKIRPIEPHIISDKMDSLYTNCVGNEPQNGLLQTLVMDAIVDLVDRRTFDKVVQIAETHSSFMGTSLHKLAHTNVLFCQSAMLLVVCLLTFKYDEVVSRWPLTFDELKPAIKISQFENNQI